MAGTDVKTPCAPGGKTPPGQWREGDTPLRRSFQLWGFGWPQEAPRRLTQGLGVRREHSLRGQLSPFNQWMMLTAP